MKPAPDPPPFAPEPPAMTGYPAVGPVSEMARELERLKEENRKLREFVNSHGRTEKLFRAFLEATPLAIGSSVGSEMKFEYWNPACKALVGYTMEELPDAATWYQAVYPDPIYRQSLVDEWARRLAVASETQTPVQPLEAVLRCKDGTEKVVLFGITTVEGHNISYGLDITDRKRREQDLHNSRLQLRALLARIQEAREHERTRLAREVHDVLGQLLTGMKLDLNWLERRLSRVGDAELMASMAAKLTATSALADLMVESVQKIAHDLRPSVLDNLGLMSAIQSETRLFAERTGISCEVAGEIRSNDLPPDITTQIFRIFQELLTNIARHAQASKVRIALKRTEGHLEMVVEDNGRGMPTEALKAPESLGLLGMSERAALLGGHITFARATGGGTRAVLSAPVMNGSRLGE